MNSENRGEQSRQTPQEVRPFPPGGMDLMEYLELKEDAKLYIEMVMYLYSNLAFDEEDPEQKEKFDNESNRHADLLKSMKWMDVEVAKRSSLNIRISFVGFAKSKGSYA
ncbi:hypothetical protein BJF83_15205 [Nocardiopsis sp. CNR-923]|uniref:hypothetical protein n=1 Tax=Nocardiopsis sp. CNR-923 TaxID=1904965 RepID=UPI00095D7DF9|nr:hypothetical protein [Nocardiopsis sp. CNR-923]OLT28602.1 hypothetical protein BJF83_15205 [Nocardiopsis sp. CNR-923]